MFVISLFVGRCIATSNDLGRGSVSFRDARRPSATFDPRRPPFWRTMKHHGLIGISGQSTGRQFRRRVKIREM